MHNVFVHIGQMVYFRWQPVTSLQNFIHLRQSAAELLMFVQKSKMAAAAILDLIFVQYFAYPHVGPPGKYTCQISCKYVQY